MSVESAQHLPFVAVAPGSNQQAAIDPLEAILEASDALRALLGPHLAEFGLNDARFSLLKAVSGGARGGCSQTYLARELHQSESNISTLLERMRRDGLISRQRSLTDRRKSTIRATTRGRELLDRIRAAQPWCSRVLLANTPPDDRQVVARILQDLLEEWCDLLRSGQSLRQIAGARKVSDNPSMGIMPEVCHEKAG